MNTTKNLFEQTLSCLLINDPQQKVEATLSLHNDWLDGNLSLQPLAEVKPLAVTGRPEHPDLVDAREVPRRNFASLKGRLPPVHAIAHIAFIAILMA